MPDETPLYDLMLLLSTSAEEEQRAKILADVESTISRDGGSIANNADWGVRALAYRIEHQADAEYHLLQFTGPPQLLESLSHDLGITDGVLRHRIIKVLPGTPPAPRPERAVPSRAQHSRAPAAGQSPADSGNEAAAAQEDATAAQTSAASAPESRSS